MQNPHRLNTILSLAWAAHLLAKACHLFAKAWQLLHSATTCL